MGETTKIEWCDHTFNPWIGCTRVGPGCGQAVAPGHPEGAGCYAEALAERYGFAKWGPGQPRKRTSVSNWKLPQKWDRNAGAAGTRPFVFCASLADVFDNEVPEAWRAELFDLIRATPNLVWLLLTKRIGNVIEMLQDVDFRPADFGNVAFGATMVSQLEYHRDSRKLEAVKRATGAIFTFGSFEPLLGPIILDRNAPDWIIVGGESGRNARSMDLDWPRSLQQQSADLGRVFNFKQVGGSGRNKGGHTLDGRTYLDRPQIAVPA